MYIDAHQETNLLKENFCNGAGDCPARTERIFTLPYVYSFMCTHKYICPVPRLFLMVLVFSASTIRQSVPNVDAGDEVGSLLTVRYY